MGTRKGEIIVKTSFDNLHFPTRRKKYNFIECDTTCIYNGITEWVILKHFKDEKRLWVKAKRAILCL